MITKNDQNWTVCPACNKDQFYVAFPNSKVILECIQCGHKIEAELKVVNKPLEVVEEEFIDVPF